MQLMGHWKFPSSVEAELHWPYSPAVHGVSHETVESGLNMSEPPVTAVTVLSFMERSTKVAVELKMNMPPP